MTTYVVDSEADRAMLLAHVKARKMPFTVDVVKGKHRSTEQNKLQRKWMGEIAEQLGDRTPEEVRGECKLTFGVPILRAENTAFREKYDAIVKPLPYEQKVQMMMMPLDLPVTRIMTTDQKTRYLDGIHRHFSSMGIVLTNPEERRASAATRKREAA